jgi:hypothetical protein
MKKVILFFFITINSFSQENLFNNANEIICDSLVFISKGEKLESERVDSVIKNCTKYLINDFKSEIIKYRVYNNGNDSAFFDFFLYQISINCESYRNFYFKDLDYDISISDFTYSLINDIDINKLKIQFNKRCYSELIEVKKQLNLIKDKTLLITTISNQDNYTIYKNSFFIPISMEEIYSVELIFKNRKLNFIEKVIVKDKLMIQNENKSRIEQTKKYKDLPLPSPLILEK